MMDLMNLKAISVTAKKLNTLEAFISNMGVSIRQNFSVVSRENTIIRRTNHTSLLSKHIAQMYVHDVSARSSKTAAIFKFTASTTS